MGHNTNALARRSARIYAEGGELMEIVIPIMGPGTKSVSDTEDSLIEKTPHSIPVGPSNPATKGVSRVAPVVNLGRDLCTMFPSTSEDMGKSVIKSLQAARISDKKVEGRPLNFGTVLPKAIYRSSYPQIEDFQFIASLGLKTIVTLVDKDISADFQAFMKANRIKHVVFNMAGTKKVPIPESVMHQVMEVMLDQKNHPLLMHCNQGKHRTGCVIAILRLLAGWDVDSTIEEYRDYAAPKVRENDIKYIEEYQLSSLEGLFNKRPAFRPGLFTGQRMLRSLIGSVTVILLFCLMNATSITLGKL